MSKKYFGTDGIRGRVGVAPITAEFVLKLGWAVGVILAKKDNRNVLIGKDTRISGYMLESALEAGLSAAGAHVHLLGPMPTPGIAYLTNTLQAQAGIVISASHNPYYDNGIKLFSARGIKLKESVEKAIETQLEQAMITVAPHCLGKATRITNAQRTYIEFCKSTWPTALNLNGLKVVIDCANGATYHIAPHVFSELGADVVAIGVEPDGLNINEYVGATYLKHLKERVLAENADLGIAFDGDGDRVMMIDHTGEPVDGDDLLYILARSGLKTGWIHGGVVGTVMSNLGLELALNKLGLSFLRAQVGDRYVNEALQAKGWLLGGETSGHIVRRDLTTTGDGIVAALQVLLSLKLHNKTLHEYKSSLKKFPQILLNIQSKTPRISMQSEKLQRAVQGAERALAKQGRILVRPSGTEPLIRIMVESTDLIQAEQIAKDLAEIVQSLKQ